MDKSQRTIITGGGGFIGSKLAKKLIEKNNNVHCLDRSRHSLFEVESLKDLLEDTEVIYHLAGATAGNGHNPGQETLIKNNIIATGNLIEGINRFCNKPPFLINLSTIQVYDRIEGNLDETSNLSPNNIYGVSKLAQELLIIQANNIGILKSINFRVSNVYGEGHKPYQNSVVATFCDKINNGLEVDLFSNGKANIDLIYIDDVVEVLSRIDLIKFHHGKTYNLASGSTISIDKVIEKLQLISGSTIKTNLIDGPVIEFTIDIDKLLNDFPNVQYHDLDDGLKKTYESTL